jgi:nitroreductase
MTSAIEALLIRRTIPAPMLGDPAPEGEALDQILTAAARVPDHGKLVPWRFILYRGEGRALLGERLEALRRQKERGLSEDDYTYERTRFLEGPLTVGVISRASWHAKIPVIEQRLSAGAVCMNILNAAHALGFAGQWLTDWCAYDQDAVLVLGGQRGERFAGFIHLGTPTVPPAERPRPPLAQIVTEWQPT